MGIAFSTYQTVGLNSFAQSLRQEQFVGTLESVLITPIRIPTFLAGSALWDSFTRPGEVALYLIVGAAAFGLNLGNANAGAVAFAGLLTLTTFMGLGVLAAAFILRFKRGNPVTWIIASAGELFGGVYFPTDILPPWMRSMSEWVPMTHAFKAFGRVFSKAPESTRFGRSLIFLLAFTFVIWPIGILAFHWALRRSQNDGTLGHY